MGKGSSKQHLGDGAGTAVQLLICNMIDHLSQLVAAARAV